MKKIMIPDNIFKTYSFKIFTFNLVFFILTCSVSYAQNYGAMLIPRIMYVGDHATLVLSMPGTARDMADIVLTGQSLDFLRDENIDFHRILLERRMSGSRLLIEFTAFAPGTLELPVIEIDGERFSGLTVTVNSLLSTGSGYVLSGPASSLVMPGTSLMLYGTMAGFVLLLLLVIWFIFRGRRYLQKWAAVWKQWRLFASVKNMEKRLHKALLKGANKRLILDRISDEFRVFLSFFTGINCRAMTAREFEKLAEYNPLFLKDFFGKCDELRFCGAEVNSDDVLHLLADLRFFVGEAEKTGKEKPAQEKAA
jgi:hypothetical protein